MAYFDELDPQTQSLERERLNGKEDPLWIIDTGATHLMAGHLDLLLDLHNITPVSVSLPARHNLLSYRQETVRLTSHLVMKNVYFIDGFHTNLISLGQLLMDNFIIGQVTDKLVVLQDRIMRILIGVGSRKKEGLYHF